MSHHFQICVRPSHPHSQTTLIDRCHTSDSLGKSETKQPRFQRGSYLPRPRSNFFRDRGRSSARGETRVIHVRTVNPNTSRSNISQVQWSNQCLRHSGQPSAEDEINTNRNRPFRRQQAHPPAKRHGHPSHTLRSTFSTQYHNVRALTSN